jgi:hypothetical protein
VPALVAGLLIGVLFASPWIAGIALIRWRSGVRLLSSDDGAAFPTQASQLRSFGGR